MFSVDKTVSVNGCIGPGEPPLDRSAVWRGLVMKAEDARPFVPVMEACDVRERGDGWLVREIRIAGETMHERITFHPEHTVEFERLDGIERGTILNEILEDGDGNLSLKFSFTLSREDMEDGSAEEAAYAASMEGTYLKAVQSTLDTIRRLVSDGVLGA